MRLKLTAEEYTAPPNKSCFLISRHNYFLNKTSDQYWTKFLIIQISLYATNSSTPN